MTRAPTNGFDRVARMYAPLERLTFGRSLEESRETFLGEMNQARRTLVLGDGDGRFCAALLARFPELEVTAVDASAAMLTLLSRNVSRVCPGARLSVVQADVRALALPAEEYDQVVTHFFLDCLTSSEVEILVSYLVPRLVPRARWVLSEFDVPSGFFRAPAWLLVRTLYFVFRALTGLSVTQVPDYARALTAHGFVRVGLRTRIFGLLRAELWERNEGRPPLPTGRKGRPG